VPSPIVWPVRAWNVGLTIVAAIGGAFIFLFVSIVCVVAAALLGQVDSRHPMAKIDPLIIAQLIAYVPTAIYFAGLLPQLTQLPLRELGFRAPRGRDLAVAMLGVVAMYVIVNGLGALSIAITHRHDTEAAIDLLQHISTQGERIGLVLMACVVAPMVEELVFRVFLFNALTRYMTIPLAAIISGIVFGSAHMQGLGTFVTFALPLGGGGVVLAYVYSITRNYWSNVITHGTFNAISVIAVLVFHAT
jgi:membrane protease YdiL (CAAX protease family)